VIADGPVVFANLHRVEGNGRLAAGAGTFTGRVVLFQNGLYRYSSRGMVGGVSPNGCWLDEQSTEATVFVFDVVFVQAQGRSRFVVRRRRTT